MSPLDEGSARRRDLSLKTYNPKKRQANMPPAGFEPTISVGERPQTHALDRAATAISTKKNIISYFCVNALILTPSPVFCGSTRAGLIHSVE